MVGCRASWVVLTGLSVITLQYVPHKKPADRRWPSVLYFLYALIGTTLLGIIINTYPTAVTLADWSTCPIQYFNVCYLMVLYNPSTDREDELPSIVMRDSNNDPSKHILIINYHFIHFSLLKIA